ncbi:hypothetical protein PQX77_014472 [Marasmius sp. AFHP31]|nr:hypothetical protein PQX77_014472 [Marasmius sp. AFHP31]
MRHSFTALSILLSSLSTLIRAIPVTEPTGGDGSFSGTGDTDIILFDSPASSSHSGPLGLKRSLTIDAQAFVYNKQINLEPLETFLRVTLDQLGAGPIPEDLMSRALDRMQLFAASGVARKEVTVSVDGCDQEGTLPPASEVDLGISSGVVEVEGCGWGHGVGYGNDELSLTANGAIKGDESGLTAQATVFTSGSEGFGVISDIDDTIKISEGTDKVKFITSTLFDDATPVPGMPDVYKSLASSLSSPFPFSSKPQFIYISASPYQLYPYLRTFLQNTFDPSTHGPLFLQNITLSEISELLTILDSDTAQKVEYKTVQIARVQKMYPRKSFLTVGDSTQGDPEVYARAFKTYGPSFIRCIWIRLVEGGDNSPERFAAAFEGISEDRVRLFDDSQIAALADIDVKGGQC